MSVTNLNYLNENSYRAYPLRELARTSTDGVMYIPDSFVVDFAIAYSSNVTAACFISRIIVDQISIVLDIADISTGNIIGSFTVPVTQADYAYAQYQLVPSNMYAGANGKLVVCSVSGISDIHGTFLFLSTATQFEATTIVPSMSGVNSITFINANGQTFSLTGNVTIKARQNFEFKYDALHNTVTLDAGNGLGLNQSCALGQPITTINNIPPDSNGNFNLLGTACATFTSIPNGLLLTDTCAQPCLGCTDIATLSARVNLVEDNLLALTGNYLALNTAYDNFKTQVDFSCSC